MPNKYNPLKRELDKNRQIKQTLTRLQAPSTIEELLVELEQATNFSPHLKKYYFDILWSLGRDQLTDSERARLNKQTLRIRSQY